jgi:predicted metalloprotease with PDZ domain
MNKPTMRKLIFLLLLFSNTLRAQNFNEYEISFENAVHHEATISVTFKNVKENVLEVRMSRSSPGRYALHEFAKNVYNVKAVDGNGKQLSITRPNPHQWNVTGHNGTVKFTYTLFGNRADGTYSQIDETHAHLNMPATFAFARGHDAQPVKISFKLREDLKWKVATQLQQINATTFSAPNLQYMMDSPVEISNFFLRDFEQESNGKKYTIRLALHHQGPEVFADRLVEQLKKIVLQEKAAMGGLPDYDFGSYTFLACYMPQGSGDAMEHRNSTFVCGSSLNDQNFSSRLESFSHEFFHCWNVERLRPASLEPFNFEEANMSGELWFAEGFTNYYTNLFLCRAGLVGQKQYVSDLSSPINSFQGSPGRFFFNPIEMSYQAPFSDAATSIDPTNMVNTFISYYTYGEVIGLALDLSLRNLDAKYSLDDFMKLMWTKYGKTEKPYTVEDVKTTLSEYVNADFATNFFNQFIFKGEFPPFEKLFEGMGIKYQKASPSKSYLGAPVGETEQGIQIIQNTRIGTPAYKAGLENGDIMLSIGGQLISSPEMVDSIITKFSPGKEVEVLFKRFGQEKKCMVTLEEDPTIRLSFFEDERLPADEQKMKQRLAWLNPK